MYYAIHFNEMKTRGGNGAHSFSTLTDFSPSELEYGLRHLSESWFHDPGENCD